MHGLMRELNPGRTDTEDVEFRDFLIFDTLTNSWQKPQQLPATFKGIR